MKASQQSYRSKRHAQIVTVSGSVDQVEPEPVVGRAMVRVENVKQTRDIFDFEGRQVGLRDSTWLLVSALVLLMMIITWRHAAGLELFGRLLVVAGGVTIAATVTFRKILDRE